MGRRSLTGVMRRSVAVQAGMAVMLALAGCNPTVVNGAHGIPAARAGASSAYDPANGTIVMFGGADRSGVLGDTWIWDGAGWQLQHPIAPPPAREFAWMGFDPATSRVVLFGGIACAPPGVDDPIGCEYQNTQTTLADTWTWDGSSWSQLHTAQSPPVFSFRGDFGGMAGDATHHNLILVTYGPPDPDHLVQSWILRSGDWQRLQSKHTPPAIEFSGPAYDAVTGRLIVQQQGGRSDTTWSWNGSDWQDLGPSVNSPHSYGQLVSVGGLGVMLIGEGSEYNWTGKSWTNYQQLPQSVSLSLRPRDGWTAAYHEPTHELVLVGGRAGAAGNHLLADTAGWDGSKWKTLVQAPPSPKVPLASCSAKRAASGFGFGGNTDPSGASIAVDFFEPLSGPCHLHVDVVLSLLGADGSLLNLPGNPSTQPVDVDLTWEAGGQAVIFDVPGLCVFGQSITARIQAGDLDTLFPVISDPTCQTSSPPLAPSITSSVRPTGLRP